MKLWTPHLLWMVPAIGAGIVAGLAGYTFTYAKGYSYLTDDPKACVNCHVMREQFQSWEVSIHRSVRCNECHVPQGFVSKWATKAKNGFNHSWAFTFEDVQVIHPSKGTLEVVQENCVRCHAPTVEHLSMRDGMRCFDCHSETRHTR